MDTGTTEEKWMVLLRVSYRISFLGGEKLLRNRGK